MTFMLHSCHLSLPLAWAMNHTVHTVLALCLPSATCCLCCCSSSCCCCCTFSKLFSILSFAITDTSPPSSPLPSSFPSPSFADADFHFVSQFDFISLCQSLCIHLRAASLFLSALLLSFVSLPHTFHLVLHFVIEYFK